MSKLTDAIVGLIAKVVIPLAERIQQRRERTPRPTLDPPLKTLSIDEAVARARADLERRRRRDANGQE